MTTGLDTHVRYDLPIWAVRAARIIVNEARGGLNQMGALHAHKVRAVASLIVVCQEASTLECGPWSGIPVEVKP